MIRRDSYRENQQPFNCNCDCAGLGRLLLLYYYICMALVGRDVVHACVRKPIVLFLARQREQLAYLTQHSINIGRHPSQLCLCIVLYIVLATLNTIQIKNMQFMTISVDRAAPQTSIDVDIPHRHCRIIFRQRQLIPRIKSCDKGRNGQKERERERKIQAPI